MKMKRVLDRAFTFLFSTDAEQFTYNRLTAHGPEYWVYLLLTLFCVVVAGWLWEQATVTE